LRWQFNERSTQTFRAELRQGDVGISDVCGKFVMPGLVPGIHVLKESQPGKVDGRDKPGMTNWMFRLREINPLPWLPCAVR
jgi:hypothetical protein